MITVIGISAVSGGGKTAVARRLAEVLGDAVAPLRRLRRHQPAPRRPPELVRGWSRLRCLRITCLHLSPGDIEGRRESSLSHRRRHSRPGEVRCGGRTLGREHSASGRFIDLMVFVDTPLDIAMARRILRNLDEAAQSAAAETLEHVNDELYGYEARARPIYEHFQERMRAGADLIVDGTLGIDRIVDRICSEIESRRSLMDRRP